MLKDKPYILNTITYYIPNKDYHPERWATKKYGMNTLYTERYIIKNRKTIKIEL